MSDEQTDATEDINETVTSVVMGCLDYGFDHEIKDAPESIDFFRLRVLRLIDGFVKADEKRVVGHFDHLFGRLFYDARPVFDLRKGNGIQIFYSAGNAPWKSMEIFHDGSVR